MRREKKPRLPKLPVLLERKIYKTGQTRGADDDVIYQNRVSRCSTVLIPYLHWEICAPEATKATFANGFIALIPAAHYFGTSRIDAALKKQGLAIGENALVFYQTRAEWNANNPDSLGWTAASRRTAPLAGQYVARVAATTAAKNSAKIIRGFTSTKGKGAGIRLFEYADADVIEECRLQLEALFWLCRDASKVTEANGMPREDIALRQKHNRQACAQRGLLDLTQLRAQRIVNAGGRTVCPLCLKELSAAGFFSRLEQAQGREVHDLTVTQINLFHVAELRYGCYNHRPYNLGWGHHHCNVVVKDAGILPTLHWMDDVLRANRADGRLSPAASKNASTR